MHVVRMVLIGAGIVVIVIAMITAGTPGNIPLTGERWWFPGDQPIDKMGGPWRTAGLIALLGGVLITIGVLVP